MRLKYSYLFFQLIIAFSLICSFAYSQNFTASTNRKTVPLGEVFQINFTINTNGSGFKAPDFKDFDVYSGPNQSTSMSIINGQVSQSISLSYLLAGKKEGKFTIGPASITVNGKKIESNAVSIEVTKGNQPAQNNNNGNNPNNTSGSGTLKNEYSASGSGDDIFIRTYVTKQKCFLGEQLVVTQKVYSRYQLKGFNNFKPATANGFWSKDEDRNKQITLESENLDGIAYYVAEFSKTFLFPQRTGTLEIGPIELEAIVTVQSKKKPKSFWDQFFGGGGYEDVLYKLKGKPVNITVNPLPETNKPANFSGAVGNFNFKAELDHDKVKENEAINLKITVSGKGNINLIDNPKITFPSEFETYDPKISENISIGNIVNGSKTYEYLIIPRKKGQYKISDFSFSYFDTDKKDYVTLPAPEMNITVEPGAPGSAANAKVYVPTNKIAETENDIRYIKKGNLELKEKDTEFFSSPAHYTFLGGLLIFFLAGSFARKKHIQNNSDLVAVKERKAARMAKKQLSLAEKHKAENNKEKFYAEIFIALNKYISDKLNIPVADLNKETIRQKLRQRGYSDATLEKVIATLDSCEFVRYAPGSVSDNLNDMYQNTVILITEMEEHKSA